MDMRICQNSVTKSVSWKFFSELKLPRRCSEHPGAWQQANSSSRCRIIVPHFSCIGKNECSEMEENFMDEIRLRSKRDRETMTDERLRLILTYTMYLIGEVLGFGLAFVFILCMAGVLK